MNWNIITWHLGISLLLVASLMTLAGLSSFLKFTSMAEMLIGRLEIFPILYLIRSVRLR